MNSRERVLKTINFQMPDRVPLEFCADRSVYEGLIKKLKLKNEFELLEYLNIDFRWARPKWIGPELKDDKDNETDYFWIPRKGVKFGYAVRHPLSDVENIKDLKLHISKSKWPKPEYWDYDSYIEEAKKFREEGYAVYGGQYGWVFSAASDLVGMNRFMMMMIDNPELAFRIMEKITDFFYGCNKIMFEKTKGFIDIYLTGDDYGQQNGPLISYSLWNKLVKPHLKRLYSLAKRHGLYITHHSCGSVTYVLNDLIEIGVDIIDPVQVRAYDMNFDSLVKRYRGLIVLQGSIDTQKTLPFGKKEDIQKEVISRINFFKKKGGFILGPTQNLLSEIPLDNILTMYETALIYGKN